MDVQGDYDPVDAAGFIKVNALRYLSTTRNIENQYNGRNNIEIKVYLWFMVVSVLTIIYKQVERIPPPDGS